MNQVLNESDGCHGPTIQDGPFPWNNSIGVNSILSSIYFKCLKNYFKNQESSSQLTKLIL